MISEGDWVDGFRAQPKDWARDRDHGVSRVTIKIESLDKIVVSSNSTPAGALLVFSSFVKFVILIVFPFPSKLRPDQAVFLLIRRKVPGPTSAQLPYRGKHEDRCMSREL